ncbi:MAG: WG repeat-containing protein [Bacteroidota bacterium]
MKTKLLPLIAALFFVFSGLYAQEFDSVQDAPFEDEFGDGSSAEVISKPKNNGNYNKTVITGDYFWFTKKYAGYNKGYGIMKGDEIIIPNIFKRNTYQSTMYKKALSLGSFYGLFNLQSRSWDIPMIYRTLEHFGNSVYKVKKGQYAGLVDGNNNVLVDFQWKSITKINGLDNYVFVSNNSNLYGIYNLISKKVVVEPQYRSISKLKDDSAFKVENTSNHFNIIDINDKPRFKKWYKVVYPTRRGRRYFIVKSEGKMGIIDENESIVVPLTYQKIETASFNDGSHLAINKDGKYGCLSIDGNITLPFVYDKFLRKGYGNMAISTKNQKCGIVQINNGLPFEIATCDYDEITQSNDVFIVEQGKKFGLMDFYGQMKTDLKYDSIKSVANGLLLGKEDKDWVLINKNGTQLSDSKFEEISILSQPLKTSYYNSNPKFSYLVVRQNGKYGIIDKVGNEVLKAEYEGIVNENDNMIIFKKGGKYGIKNLLSGENIANADYGQIIMTAQGCYCQKDKGWYLIKLDGSNKIERL